MIPVFVDSNILIDVVDPRSPWRRWSERRIADIACSHSLVINPVVFGEISVNLAAIEDVYDFLGDSFRVEDIPLDAAFAAGKAFYRYRRRGGARHAILPDFLIGAHAAVAGYRLLTRDAKRFRSYFPRLELIAPTS